MNGKEDGFSLLELSISLVVIGLLAAAGWSVLKPSIDLSEKIKVEKELSRAQEALESFALNNYRLPCPDTNQDGYEESCSSNSSKTGGLPYATLGLDGRESLIKQWVYGVYRGSGNLDLTQLVERTGNNAGDVGYKSLDDLLKALDSIAVLATTNTQVYVTGDGARSGAESCSTNVVANAAFWIASPGLRSMDGDANLFDGLNQNLKVDGTGSLCFLSPDKIANANYDDQVQGVGVNTLKGKLISLGYALKN
jgi:prepilin-type N-terminal cleavage/methylation domain-containing protein